jgi:hypothetical protein
VGQRIGWAGPHPLFEKGGFVGGRAGVKLLSELVHQLAHRAVVEVELLSHVLLGFSVDEDRAQRFVLSVIGLRWVREVALNRRIVHDRPSLKMSVDYWACHGEMVPPWRPQIGQKMRKAWRNGRSSAEGRMPAIHAGRRVREESTDIPKRKAQKSLDFLKKMSVD